MDLPQILLFSSALIIGLLGFAHIVLTYRGPKLLPRDPTLQEHMASVSPVITTQTDFWRCWIGFNASHSMGAMLFGLVYGYLAMAQNELLFHSVFLQIAGFLMVAGFALLAQLYWFITPKAGTGLALLLYSASLVMVWTT